MLPKLCKQSPKKAFNQYKWGVGVDDVFGGAAMRKTKERIR